MSENVWRFLLTSEQLAEFVGAAVGVDGIWVTETGDGRYWVSVPKGGTQAFILYIGWAQHLG